MADSGSDGTIREQTSIDEREALAWFRADPDVIDERIRVNSTAQRHAAVIVRAALAQENASASRDERQPERRRARIVVPDGRWSVLDFPTDGAADTPVASTRCGGCGHGQDAHEFYRDSPDDACTAPGCWCGAFEDPTPADDGDGEGCEL